MFTKKIASKLISALLFNVILSGVISEPASAVKIIKLKKDKKSKRKSTVKKSIRNGRRVRGTNNDVFNKLKLFMDNPKQKNRFITRYEQCPSVYGKERSMCAAYHKSVIEFIGTSSLPLEVRVQIEKALPLVDPLNFNNDVYSKSYYERVTMFEDKIRELCSDSAILESKQNLQNFKINFNKLIDELLNSEIINNQSEFNQAECFQSKLGTLLDNSGFSSRMRDKISSAFPRDGMSGMLDVSPENGENRFVYALELTKNEVGKILGENSSDLNSLIQSIQNLRITT